MDYQAFFADVLSWIQKANQAASRYGMDSAEFWSWVADSAGDVCKKYAEHRLVIKQMTMLVEWLEEVYKVQRRR